MHITFWVKFAIIAHVFMIWNKGSSCYHSLIIMIGLSLSFLCLGRCCMGLPVLVIPLSARQLLPVFMN
ncbi:hypothetical protein [Moraxella lacunata]|uniref:hypothetical protein n=1 Tax=Moraxella lacunata TaxID=477 RepID=UPI003EDF16BC